MPKGSEAFFAFCRERELIRERKENGEAWPWTRDPVLRDFYFCNVFREDDRTTQWFRERVRDPLRDEPNVVMATIVFRWFNFMPTGEEIRDLLVSPHGYLRAALEERLRPKQKRGDKLFTGAYLIKSPHGVDKLTGLLDCMDAAEPVASKIVEVSYDGQLTLEECHVLLMKVPYLGPFMAYEIVTDLRWTWVLEKAPDLMTWASPGPGCARGLGWVLYEDPTLMPSYTSAKGRGLMLDFMRLLLEASQEDDLWPNDWKQWEMREVEHCLCEFAKYREGQAGRKLKRRYKCSQ